jgi:DNA polymerase III alpha subunit
MGRAWRGEKGYPRAEVAIRSLELVGERETYDVEMKGPAHNFVTGDGIVACNSHADSYGVRGYKTAYIKAHFPVEFFTAWLRTARHKQDPHEEVRELVNESRLFGVPVRPPDFRDGRSEAWTDGVSVHFGLASIKGVGPALVEKMRRALPAAEQSAGPIRGWKWMDFLLHHGQLVGRAGAERLIRAGALSWAGPSRRAMLAELDAWSQLTDKEQEALRALAQEARTAPGGGYPRLAPLLRRGARVKKEGGACHSRKRAESMAGLAQLLECPPTSLEDTPGWIASQEQGLMGAGLTFEKADALDSSMVNCTCAEVRAGRREGILALEVQKAREKVVQKGANKGRKMATLVLADSTAALVDAVCFADEWEKYGQHLMEGAAVVVKGERGKEGSFILREAWPARAL